MKNVKNSDLGVKKQKSLFYRIFTQWDLQILVWPGILFLLVFSYYPMYGVIMAFQEFRLGDMPGFSEWVGFKHFETLFSHPDTLQVVINTLGISFLKLLINFPMPIIFAIMINELKNKKFKNTIQTVSYLPHFISWVVTATLMFDFLAIEGGAVNEFLLAIGVIDQPIGFFTDPSYFWGLVVATDLWKELGWNSIIYIAAIAGVSQDMYEAADIDGASRLQKIWYITVMTIKPTIILLLIFQIGGMLNANFDQIMMLTKQMTNAMLKESAEVIDTFVYRLGIKEGRFSFSTAAGLLKSVINFMLLIFANWLADKAGESSLF